jgi:hypothetical protein
MMVRKTVNCALSSGEVIQLRVKSHVVQQYLTTEDCDALMMEAARTSETLVNFYQTTLCYNPEDSNLHTHRRENLKSYKNAYIQQEL